MVLTFPKSGGGGGGGPVAPSGITLTQNQIIVGQSGNVGGAVAVSGDATINSSGIVTVNNVSVQWQSFTPNVSLVGGSGNTVPVYSTNTGRYLKVGTGYFVDVYLSGDGGAEGAGTGQVNIDLPSFGAAPSGRFPCGYALNNTTEFPIWGEIGNGSATIKLYYFDTISTTAIFTGANQNNATRNIRLKFFFEEGGA